MFYAEEIATLRSIVYLLEHCPQRIGYVHCTCGGERCGMSRGGYLLSEAKAELKTLLTSCTVTL